MCANRDPKDDAKVMSEDMQRSDNSDSDCDDDKDDDHLASDKSVEPVSTLAAAAATAASSEDEESINGSGLKETILNDVATTEIKKGEIGPSSHGSASCSAIDVLSGRGGKINHHPGNVHFRNLVNSYSEAYEELDVRSKPMVTRKIVEIIREQGGKFLRFDETHKLFFEVGDEAAREKTSQSLRSVTFVKRRDAKIEAARQKIRKRDGTKRRSAGDSPSPPSRTRRNADNNHTAVSSPRNESPNSNDNGTGRISLTFGPTPSATSSNLRGPMWRTSDSGSDKKRSPRSSPVMEGRSNSSTSSQVRNTIPTSRGQIQDVFGSAMQGFHSQVGSSPEIPPFAGPAMPPTTLAVATGRNEPGEIQSLLALARDLRAQAAAAEEQAIHLRQVHANRQAPAYPRNVAALPGNSVHNQPFTPSSMTAGTPQPMPVHHHNHPSMYPHHAMQMPQLEAHQQRHIPHQHHGGMMPQQHTTYNTHPSSSFRSIMDHHRQLYHSHNPLPQHQMQHSGSSSQHSNDGRPNSNAKEDPRTKPPGT